jgi:hypothetical protein
VVELERMWFPLERSVLPSWRARVLRMRPRKEWILYLDARNGRVLSRYDATGRVFDPNPVIALGGDKRLLKNGKPVRDVPAKAYRRVQLRGLGENARLDGEHVTTRCTEKRARAEDQRFEFDAGERQFAEVMAYFHIDRAVRYLESLGYEGERRIFDAPIEVDARGTAQDQSWYSPYERRLTFGYGGVDDAHDAETILHELGHAIQDAICPDFGQSPQAAAMGEGFGDYFAASFFAAKKSARYEPTVMPGAAIPRACGASTTRPRSRASTTRRTSSTRTAASGPPRCGTCAVGSAARSRTASSSRATSSSMRSRPSPAARARSSTPTDCSTRTGTESG